MNLHHWTEPPTRREITLLLFAFTAFIIGYNLDASLSTVGLSATRRASLTKKLGLSIDPGLERDGRLPKSYRNKLEHDVVGEWSWQRGHVVETWEGDGGREGKNGLEGEEKDVLGPLEGLGDVEVCGPRKANEASVWWGRQPPTASVVTHVPGFTILDNVIYADGTLYLVNEDPWTIPIDDIASSTLNWQHPPRTREWQVILPQRAVERFGEHGAKIGGVTLLAPDLASRHDNYTLLSLYRTYSSLSVPSSPTSLPPPLRIIFPQIITYTDDHPAPAANDPLVPRVRSRTGIHPFTLKAAFPKLGLWHLEEWEDLKEMHLPFLFERVVIADRGAARRGLVIGDAAASEGNPDWANPFLRMEADQGWLEPIRLNLMRYLGIPDDRITEGNKGKAKTPKSVITYVSRQRTGSNARLRDADHQALVDGLNGLGKHYGYPVHIVEEGVTSWDEKMSALVQSTIVLGVYGESLVDTVFMRPSQRATIMEFFPSGTYIRDRQIPARSLGIKYMAWWNNVKMSDESLPAVFPPPADGTNEEIPLDAKAVVQAIREELSRKS
ncbi:hypothetical protein JAAARDRAFT_128853 [Jaapia argillacea MUCL 33604]|uniref:Uncharacterized protein n=1 Tax=Jaapia argillacea MUCL 33604 TaxID=933084 RepID=A0A067Q5D0_9AGAM|nr:hypothetical protein JAAARDRAFT_128853 [Jaapia argillacea MUCL 33604]